MLLKEITSDGLKKCSLTYLNLETFAMEVISKYRFDPVTLEIMNNFEVLKKHEEEIPEEVRNAKKRNAETMEDK